MRVNVQLIDAETGSHLWAERFDKPLADLFDMRDEIVARLAGALNTELVAAEARRAEQALALTIAALGPKKDAELTIIRNGSPQTVKVTLGALPDDKQAQADADSQGSSSKDAMA